MNDLFRQEIQRLLPEIAEQVAKLINTVDEARAQNCDVFVIIAFSDDMEPIFEGIHDAASHHGLKAERVKDIVGDYRITDKVISMIKSSRMIVADITHERPNVYFEIGYARGLGKEVITVARKGTEVHFDVKDWPCLFYDDSRTLERQLKIRLAPRGSKV